MPNKLISNGELILFGIVGMSFFDDDGFTARQVVSALEELPGDINVRINSGGGLAFDGIAIHNALKSHDGKVTVMIDGIAASAASIIAMAGDEIIMRSGALMMIHDASGITFGTAGDHLKTAALLEKLDGEIAAIYAARAGGDADHFKELMDSEAWLSADEAISEGLATGRSDEEAAEPSAFAYELYQKAPDWLIAQRAARFDAEGDRFARTVSAYCGRQLAAQAAAPHSQQKETPTMTGKKAPAAPEAGTGNSTSEITLDYVTSSHPDIAAALRNEGTERERDRILGIEQNALPGHEKLVAELKADGKTSPDAAAARILRAENEKRSNQLQAMKDADADAKDVPADPSAEQGGHGSKKKPAKDEAGLRDEYESSEKLRDEFETVEDYAAFKKNEHAGRIKVLGAK